MTRALREFSAVALITLHCAACAARQRTGATEAPPPLQILETLPASGSIEGVDLYPLVPGTRRYQIVEGDGQGSELVVTCAATTEHQATIACSEGSERTLFWRADDHGSIVMTAAFEAKDDALSLFGGPMILAPKELNLGEGTVTRTVMRVVDPSNMSRVRESGHASRTVQYMDDQRIRTSLGEFIAKRVVIQFKADLRMADADETTTLWVVPGTGVFARRSEEQIKVLGLGGKRKVRTLVLVESP